MREMLFGVALVTSLVSSGVLACEPTQPPARPTTQSAPFNDFTFSDLESVNHLRQVAAAPPGDDIGASIVGVKFVVTQFSTPHQRSLRFLDGRHYLYHDEWAWFRLLNGHEVPGMAPMAPRPVNTPREGRQWAKDQVSALPDGLTISDERVYSAAFYDLALATGVRKLGAGSVVHIPARPGLYPEIWGFELEYEDRVTVEDTLVFFEILEAHVPVSVRAHLKWITRSPHQAEIARQLVAAHPAFATRVMSYEAVAVPGETIIYAPGIAAGRLQTFRDLSDLSSASPDDILLLGALPEYLPQARGVLTSIPQTPLSHLNLLAKSRGIVNAYRGGLFDDPAILNLARSSAPVVLSTESGELRFKRITEEQYALWMNLQKTPPPPPRRVVTETAPYVVDLSHVDPREIETLAPLIGGKSVGMIHLLHALGPAATQATPGSVAFDVPERPLAITVRAYREHLKPLLPELRRLLDDPTFVASRKLRVLALEGIEKFEDRFTSKKDRDAARTYLSPSAGGAIAPIVRRGGLQRIIRKTPLPTAVQAELERVAQHFSNYAPEQGLRFRSSSTVEDVEGSAGAGLYESFTGYALPRAASAKGAKRTSLADALRKTWASYFSVEAFEERHESGMDHLAGDMAVLVHARFDDELEAANGVFTMTINPQGAELWVDAQPGSVSVTNPPTDRVVRPETSRVVSTDTAPRVIRLAQSSEASGGGVVVGDVELLALFEQARRLALAQLERSNALLPPPQRRRSLVMDFEFRRVTQGWPALRHGVNPPRFVIKQMRPLEPNPGVPVTVRAEPIPRDVLARVRRVERRTCTGEPLTVEVLLAYTDPNVSPDPGYTKQPLFASVTVDAPKRDVAFTHLDVVASEAHRDGFTVDLGAGRQYTRLVNEGQMLQLSAAGSSPVEYIVQCRTAVEFAAPTELLRSFLE